MHSRGIFIHITNNYCICPVVWLLLVYKMNENMETPEKWKEKSSDVRIKWEWEMYSELVFDLFMHNCNLLNQFIFNT